MFSIVNLLMAVVLMDSLLPCVLFFSFFVESADLCFCCVLLLFHYAFSFSYFKLHRFWIDVCELYFTLLKFRDGLS